MWWAICYAVYKDIRVYRLTHTVFFSSTHLCTSTDPQMVHTCLHKMCPQVFFEQEVLCVLPELNESEITHIVCAHAIFLQVLSELYRIRIIKIKIAMI